MDPLSISASVITLLHASGKLSKLLRKGVNLKDAPDVLLALNNEVSDLQLLVSDVDDLLRLAMQQCNDQPPRSLISVLERVKSTLLELRSFISYELTIVSSDGANVRVDKSVFFRAGHRLQAFKDDVRAARMALGSALSLFTTSIVIQSQFQSKQVYCAVEPVHSSHKPAFDSATPRIHRFLEQSSYSQATIQTDKTRSNVVQGQEQPAYNTTMIQIFEKNCSVDCCCTCHSYNRVRSPNLLSSFIGSLFIGYRALPSPNQMCSDARCLGRYRHYKCTYTFPRWLLHRAISITYSSTLSKAPELLLRVMRMRDLTRIRSILCNVREPVALKEVKARLDSNQISVLDRDQYEDTILNIAVRDRRWSIVHLLISYGADMHLESKFSRSPFIDAWTWRFWLVEPPGDMLKQWDKMFLQTASHLDVFGFSDLHKAYLGPCGLTFGQVLGSTRRSDIDEEDYQGRTVLWWAARRADFEKVAQLLASGADPNKKDNAGWTPFHVGARDVATAELLLDAKADVRVSTIYGLTPMHSISDSTTPLIQRMVDLGADIDQRTSSGQTPLSYACGNGQVHVARELLACGADINARCLKGDLPIYAAVYRNYHHLLQILIANPYLRYEAEEGDSWDVFQLAAVFGDVHTLEILKVQWPGGINFKNRREWGNAVEFARYRRDHNRGYSSIFIRRPDADPIAWYEAFMDMVYAITQRQARIYGLGDEEGGYEDESDLEVWEDAIERLEDI